MNWAAIVEDENEAWATNALQLDNVEKLKMYLDYIEIKRFTGKLLRIFKLFRGMLWHEKEKHVAPQNFVYIVRDVDKNVNDWEGKIQAFKRSVVSVKEGLNEEIEELIGKCKNIGRALKQEDSDGGEFSSDEGDDESNSKTTNSKSQRSKSSHGKSKPSSGRKNKLELFQQIAGKVIKEMAPENEEDEEMD